jgi:hypothetical protein
MKTKRLTSLLVMLTMSFGAFAQEEFVDDVYFSSGKSKSTNNTKTETVSAVSSGQSGNAVTTVPAKTTVAYAAPASSGMEMDVDAYNRHYSDYEAAEDFTDNAYYL